jgi:hypothetical protein
MFPLYEIYFAKGDKCVTQGLHLCFSCTIDLAWAYNSN